VVVRVLPEVRGPAPEKPTTPSGPIVQETTGEKAPARTYQDLLQSPHDAELFEYYGTSEVVTIAVNGGGALERVATPGIHAEVSPSPDGRFVLLETLQKPFSYLVPYYRFAHRVEVRDRSGNVVREMARLTLAENVPIGRNAVPTGPRSFGWRADSDATLFWVEAQDEGDPRTETKTRDKLFVSRAPFDEGPREIASLGLRFRSVYWGNDDLALVREWWWSDRRERISRMAPGNVGAETKSLFDYSYEDRYNVPGLPLLEPTERGERVLAMSSDGKRIFMTAEGASPEGNRPFLDSYDLETGEKTRLFRSEAPYYEFPLAWLDEQRGTILTQRESQTTPPNFFVRSIGNTEADVRALTEFPHPYPALARARRELVRYDRADGVKLTATLHLPGDYDPTQGTLPMLVWAYPREYKSADAAAQVRESPHRFSRVSWGSPLYWLTQGFAIMENATMPIVGEEDEEPNDSYVEQLVQSAQAAVDEAVRRGVADPDRVGIAGHSYGAFMTANLLAHSDIFRAGIARSGAFNRTLTPFGFQSEERTFWEAPEVYFAMSPFMHAHKVDEPILLIHGEADNNSGTFPIQSRRFYHALKGHGAKARLVMLPHESHGYRARESVLHTLWEMNEWLGQYVKNAPPRSATSNDMN
jgi:dipeptidyl aminopeptidase/acylaminoacyl peptidase